MNFLARLATTMLVFLVIGSLFSDDFYISNWGAALGAAFVLAILNKIIKPIIVILTLPLNLITFGLFTIVIDAIMLELTSSVVGGFSFSSFGWAIIIAIILSIVNAILTADL